MPSVLFPSKSNYSNISSSLSFPPVWIAYRFEVQVWFAIVLFISIAGVIFNSSLIVIILSSKKLLRGSRILLLNLLICSTVQCVFGVPMVNATIYDSSFTTISFCSGVDFIYLSTYFAVDWADLMISINRLVAIVFPHLYYRMIETTTVIACVSVSWIIPFVLSLLTLLKIIGQYGISQPWNNCAVTTSRTLDVMSTVGFYIPTAATTVCYAAIFITMAQQMSRNRRVTEANNTPVILARRKVIWARRYRTAKMFFVTFCFYTVCLLAVPIVLTAAKSWYFSLPLLQLFFRILTPLGYFSIPVSHLYW